MNLPRGFSQQQCEDQPYIFTVILLMLTFYFRQIWSASGNGEIKLWDIRKSASVKTFQSVESLTAFAVHDYASVFAVGSSKQKIKVFNFSGDDTLIRYHEGFLGQRIGPVTCLKFHPYLDLLAAGAADYLISIYTKRIH